MNCHGPKMREMYFLASGRNDYLNIQVSPEYPCADYICCRSRNAKYF